MMPTAGLAAQPAPQSRAIPACARRDAGVQVVPYRGNWKTGAGAVTATALAETGGVPGGAVALTATVTEAAATRDLPVTAGTVSFYRSSAGRLLGTVSSGSRASAGVFSLSARFPANAAESVVAVYAPPAGSHYRASRSPVISFAEPAYLTAGSGVQTTADILPAGVLAISTPFTSSSAFDLGALTLNASATFYSASAPLDPDGSDVPTAGVGPANPTFNGITIVDTQTANVPWTVSAWASNLSNGGDAVQDLISGQDVGLTNLTAVAVPGNALVASDLTFSDQPSADPPVLSTDTGSLGLGGQLAHVIVTDAGQAQGTIGINGTITIYAPTSTEPGAYIGTIVLTLSN